MHALFIDVNELTDRAENALRVAGDIYTARVLDAGRGRASGWTSGRRTSSEKLKTLDDIYRFAVEQTGMARGEALELMIVLILVFELILFFMGIIEVERSPSFPNSEHPTPKKTGSGVGSWSLGLWVRPA